MSFDVFSVYLQCRRSRWRRTSRVQITMTFTCESSTSFTHLLPTDSKWFLDPSAKMFLFFFWGGNYFQNKSKVLSQPCLHFIYFFLTGVEAIRLYCFAHITCKTLAANGGAAPARIKQWRAARAGARGAFQHLWIWTGVCSAAARHRLWLPQSASPHLPCG